MNALRLQLFFADVQFLCSYDVELNLDLDIFTTSAGPAKLQIKAS